MYEKTYKLSLSMGFINKTPIKNKLAYKEGFQTFELTLRELREAIDLGMTLSYQFRDEKRSAENFEASDILAIDIDYGMTIAKALNHPIVKKYCSMFHTTFNHTQDHHRFRLIFVLPRTVTNAKELSDATRALAQRLGGDRAATDAARMFHGSKGCNPELFDKSIDHTFLDELIADGSTIPVSESISFEGSTSNRSDFRPEPLLTVKTSDGSYIQATTIDKLTPIHCPFHDDRNPSAFVSRNQRGSVYLSCPKCSKTWWLSDGDPSRVKFNDFERMVIGLRDVDLTKKIKAPLLPMFVDPELIKPDNVHVLNEKHLKIPELKDGLTFIKSPKGSGKTTYLIDVLKDIIQKYATLEEYEENTDPEVDETYFGDERVLLIGHRQALIGELCQRLKLNCYLDDRNKEFGEVWDRKNRYGVCLDSLWRVEDRQYDMVVIDESEQVLAHFFSETLGEKRYGIFGMFTRIIRNAKRVVVLDADLGWVTFTTLTDLVRSPSESIRSKKERDRIKLAKKFDVQIYINQWHQSKRTIHIYPNVSQLVQKIKQDVIGGSRVFVCSNSKKKIKSLDASLKKLEDDMGRSIERIMITSENSRNSEVQAFIKNIAAESLKYQVILTSPSLGTGIDITFPNNGQEIDSVYGIFENQVNTHFEIDQQLARVRNPRSVHVWVSPACFNFETEFEVVKHDYLKRNLLGSIAAGSNIYQEGFLEGFDPFLKLAAMVISHQRASKNFLKSNFLKYRQSQGWTVDEVPIDEDIREEGRQFFKVGKDVTKEEDILTVLNARMMDRREYERLEEMFEDDGAVISPAELAAFRRTRLELFYREPISRDLINRDSGGKYRKAVSLYEDFARIGDTPHEDFMKSRSKIAESPNRSTLQKLFVDRATQCVLIHGLLSTTPIFKKGVFDPKVVFTKDDLGKFVKASTRMKKYVDTQLGVNTQKDLESKPPQHLNKILNLIGLVHIKIKASNKNGEKYYAYRLDGDAMKTLEKLVERRREIGRNGWDFVDKKYGFTYPELEDDVPDILYGSQSMRNRKLVSFNN